MRVRPLQIVIVIIVWLTYSYAQNYNYQFERLSIYDGLTQNHITTIHQDQQGFIWIGTSSGLNRYDGKEIKQFTNDAHDTNSLHLNYIKEIFEDSKKRFWITLRNSGLSLMDREKEKFRTIRSDPANGNGLSSNDISGIKEDRFGNIWIGSYNNGLNLLRHDKDEIHFDHLLPEKKDLPEANNIKSLVVRKDGSCWFITNHAVYRIEGNEQPKFIQISRFPQASSGTKEEILSMYESKDGELLIGIRDRGVFVLSNDGVLVPFDKKYGFGPNLLQMSSPAIFSEDELNRLWIGTTDKGLFVLDMNDKKSIPIGELSGLKALVDEGSITSIWHSPSHITWLGIWGKGVYRNFWYKPVFNTTGDDPYKEMGLQHYSGIRSFNEDYEGKLWVGTHTGISRYLGEKDKFINYEMRKAHYPHDRITVYTIYPYSSKLFYLGTDDGFYEFNPQNGHYLSLNSTIDSIAKNKNIRVRGILKAGGDKLWLATNYGLKLYDLKKRHSTDFKLKHPKSIYKLNEDIYTIYHDSEENLWVGGTDLICRLRGSPIEIDMYIDRDHRITGQPKGLCLSFLEDSKHRMWIGCYGGGLSLFDHKNLKFKSYDKKNGFPDDVIYSILEDSKGYLWMSTNNGIIQFDPESELLKSFNVLDGLQSNEFNGGAYYKSYNGEMYFGGVGGFNHFLPENIQFSQYIPPIVVTAFRVFNKSRLLSKNSEGIDEIQLSYNDNAFTISFAALDYINPNKNQYMYKLVNFDQEWIKSGNKSYASYSNLQPGQYFFKVRGASGEGKWNPRELTIKIVILPPFWATTWFRIILVLIGLIAVYLAYRFVIFRLYAKRLKQQVDIKTSDLNRLNEELFVSNNKLEKNNQELEMLSIVARETGNGVFITNHNGKLIWFNEGFSKIFGWYDLQQYYEDRGDSIYKVSGNTAIKNLVDKAVDSKQSITYENYNPTKDGRNLWIKSTLTPIFDDEGNLKNLVFVDTDISELKAAKDTAETALKIQEQFLANTSHEIRTPMNGILGVTRQLIETPLTEEQEELVYAIRDSGANLLHIVNDILDISKIRAEKIDYEKIPFRLEEVLHNLNFSVKYKAVEKGLNFYIRNAADMPPVLVGDPYRLNQVLINLLGNAIKFTDAGNVNVDTKVLDSQNGKVNVLFSVTDTGIGIKSKNLEYIFESFAQASSHTTRVFGGTGLGLTISKHLIEQQGGEIWVKSKFGEGSTFYFNLIFSIGDPNWSGRLNMPSVELSEKPDLKDVEILLVDDNKVNRQIALYELTKWNARVTTAPDAMDAYRQLNVKKFDLILMDISLPEISGLDASRYIRANKENANHTTPIIALTASSLPNERDRCIEAGMNDYISKPFEPATLYLKIKHVLGLHSYTTEEAVKNVPLIEHDGIVNLHFLSERASGDLEFIKEILETFEVNFPEYLDDLKDAIEDQNWVELKKQAHRMRGAVDYIRVVELTTFLKDIELGMLHPEKNGDWTLRYGEAMELCIKIQKELKEIIKKIKTLVEEDQDK